MNELIKQMKKILLLTLSIIAFGINSCEKSNVDNSECSPEMACTAIFKIITVKILNQNQEPVILDNFEVIETSTGNDVTPKNAYPVDLIHQYGTYPIATDGGVEKLQTKTLEFRGYIGTDMIVKEQYVVKGGCCHIELVSGNLDVTVQ